AAPGAVSIARELAWRSGMRYTILRTPVRPRSDGAPGEIRGTEIRGTVEKRLKPQWSTLMRPHQAPAAEPNSRAGQKAWRSQGNERHIAKHHEVLSRFRRYRRDSRLGGDGACRRRDNQPVPDRQVRR